MRNRTDPPPPPATPPGFLAWVRAWVPALVAGLALATVAGVTGRISYLHIKALTIALHQAAQVGQIMPFGVDGLIVVGSVVLLQPPRDQPWLGWIGIGPGVAASLFANWESGIHYGVLSAIWATVPAAFFALATVMLERWAKSQFSRLGSSGRTNMGAGGDDEDDDGANDCPHHMALSAEDGLIQQFLHIRDCEWGEPSQRKLSAAFGVNRLRTAELVRPYLPKETETVPEEVTAGV